MEEIWKIIDATLGRIRAVKSKKCYKGYLWQRLLNENKWQADLKPRELLETP